jgi:hypothetical protein
MNPRATWILGALAFGIAGAAAGPVIAGEAGDGATAFHYGAAPPAPALAFYERVVLDPDRAPATAVQVLSAAHATVLARLHLAPAVAVAGRAAVVPDPVSRAAAAMAQGYTGFVVEPAAAIGGAELTQLVHTIHARWPVAPIWIETAPERAAARVVPIAGEISGLVTGPLFSEWDGAHGRAAGVPAGTRQRRLEMLKAFASSTGLPVIDVETAPAGNRGAARALASQVAALGFVPWVAPAARDRMGVGALESVPRRVLVLLDGAEEPYLPYAVAHRMLAVPLEYMGFAVDYADVRAPLPDRPLADRYAGVVTWFTDDEMPAADRYERWLTQQMDGGLRVAILGHLGFTPSADMRRRLGLQEVAGGVRAPLRIASADGMVGFEASPAPRARDLQPLAAPGLAHHLEVADAGGRTLAPIAEGDWGGMALDPYLIVSGFEGRQRWIVDPFQFLASALALPAIPIPDATTENGRRLLEIHIDGDGFPSIAELPHRPLAGEVIRREFLARYQLPTTVSVIEGEVGPAGLYPDRAGELEPVARAIFARPEVEIASHTFSHPFDWLRAQGSAPPRSDDADDAEPMEGDRLDIPGYTYSLEREIDGSVRYIDGRLAPVGKPTRVMLWSGNALPPEEAIARADALGLTNLNGDNAEEPGPVQTLAGVPSFARPVGDRLQFYAPAQNENVYTNLWHGPFYGFRRVIDYFRYTDLPRRLKPIGIYYHFYSGTKAASVSALHDVYAWALAQETFPLWVSELVERVKGFERALVARRLDGTWLLRDFGALRTVRLPAALGWPDLARSPDVAGVRELPQGRYVALVPTKQPVRALATTDAPPDSGEAAPYLESANAAVVSERRAGPELWLALRGHMPVELTVGGCRADRELAVVSDSRPDSRPEDPEDVPVPAIVVGPLGPGAGRPLQFETTETGEVHVVCR